MFNPQDPAQMQKLNRAIRSSHRKLDSFRRQRKELVQEYASADYSSGEGAHKMPVNMIALMVDVYLMHLAGSSPRIILPTTRSDILPFVADLESIVNQELQDMQFDKTLRRWVLDAIFCMGVLKCGLVDGEYVELIPGEPQPTQEYFVDIVEFDDFVFDTSATSWQKVTYIGDRYKVDYEALMDNPEYLSEGKAAVHENDGSSGMDEEDRTSGIGIANDRDYDEENWKKTAWVWDVCLPEEKVIVTFAQAESVRVPLKVVELEGPSTSPYHTLFFNEVPGNLMPLSPGMTLKSLNRSINAIYRKLVRQAERQKTLALYRYGDHDTAKSIQKAGDGDMVGVQNPELVKEVSFGGASQENLALSIQLRDMFSMMAGNLDAMGGLGPQSDTAKQDAMIASTVSQKSAKMANAVVDATVGVVRDIIYRVWNDPVRTYRTTRQVAGTDVKVEASLIPGERFGQLSDIDVKIEPFSMRYRSPNDRAKELSQLMTNLVFPMMPFLQQQGIGVNIQQLFEYLGKYMDLPELQHVLEFQGQPMPGTTGDEPKQPQVSHRTYERVNRPGATRQGNDQVIQQLAMGGKPQASQLAALGRPTGV